jgi:hypothetical protein
MDCTVEQTINVTFEKYVQSTDSGYQIINLLHVDCMNKMYGTQYEMNQLTLIEPNCTTLYIVQSIQRLSTILIAQCPFETAAFYR